MLNTTRLMQSFLYLSGEIVLKDSLFSGLVWILKLASQKKSKLLDYIETKRVHRLPARTKLPTVEMKPPRKALYGKVPAKIM